MYAVRNIRLCTKDCLCLYVCPTGASNTENSIIDKSKCIGCAACANACPSKAISMVPEECPPQQPKVSDVVATLNALSKSKTIQEQKALQVADNAQSSTLRQFALAVAKSNHLMAEDIMREAGYMLPQSDNAHVFLKALIDNPPSADFPKDAAEKLLEMLPNNDK
ncbi:MAG: 4Fe-4S binding protein [Oscillospiraceae bacterium]